MEGSVEQKIEQKIDRLLEKMDTMSTNIAVLGEQTTTVADLTKKHDQSLYGNGRPGVIPRLSALEAQCAACRVHDIIPILYGEDDKEGLIDKVRDLHKAGSKVEKWMWIVTAALTTGIVAIFLEAISK